MDGGTFDRLTRLLAGRLSRRSGLAAAVGALAAGAPAPDLEARRRHRGRRRAQRPAPTGGGGEGGGVVDEKKPCGPEPRDNQCRRHKQCCTRYCRKPKMGQKFGRCRCVKPGESCKHGRQCCGGALCQNRKCAIQVPAPACGAVGRPCAADAECCTSLICKSGACAPCVAAVCASGCAFTSVNAAYAAAADGDTIYIGPGTYPTGFLVTRDVTLAACPGVTGVTLKPDGVLMDVGNRPLMIAEDPADPTTKHTVTLRNLSMKGAAANRETLLYSNINETVSFVVEDCTVDSVWYLIAAGAGNHVLDGVKITNSQNGAFLYPSPNTGVVNLTVKDTSFANGVEVDYYSYLVYIVGDYGNVTVANSSVTNSSVGIYVYLKTQSTFTATDVTVTGCTSDTASFVFRGELDPARRANTTGVFTRVSVTNSHVGPEFYGGQVQVNDCGFTGQGPSDFAFTYLYCTDITITDTLIRGNSNPNTVGAGLFVETSANDNCNNTVNVTLAGATSVTGNSALKGSGLAISAGAPGYVITGAGGRIEGNTGSPECIRCFRNGGCAVSDYTSVSCSAP